jgi:hypothetical protein
MLLAWFFRFMLKSWKKMTNPDAKLSLISRISGAFLTFSWGIIIWVITIILLGFFPPINNFLKRMHNDIHYSVTYAIIKPLDPTAKPNKANTPGAEPEKTAEEEMQSLSEDPRIMDLMNDPLVVKAISKQDYATLMSHPKIMAIVQDPELLKKMMSLYKKLPPEALPK